MVEAVDLLLIQSVCEEDGFEKTRRGEAGAQQTEKVSGCEALGLGQVCR